MSESKASDAIGIRKEAPGGRFGQWFCSAAHPANGDVWCRRLPHTTDINHAAFSFAISEPEEWEWST